MPDAEIRPNGAVLLGRSFTCDAHAARAVRIITHVHSDHLLELRQSLRDCRVVLATPLTRDLIGILKGKKLSERITPLPYGRSYGYEDEKVTFYPAHHIIGSAQVLLETRQGKRVVYTGDIKHPPAEVLPADTLVIEATYGNPVFVRRFRDSVVPSLLELIRDSLKQTPVYIFGYHGKLQEVVSILNRSDIDVPILVSEHIFRMFEACRTHGIELKNYYLSSNRFATEFKSLPHIGLYHIGASRMMGDRGVNIILSGWQFDAACKRIAPNRYQVALSDHSDFEGLIEYVQGCSPHRLIADAYRSDAAETLSEQIRARLGIETVAMP